MTRLFGVPMWLLEVGLLTLLAAFVAAVVVLALRNRVLFRIGVRNISRRKVQSVLIVLGLMLSATIITASLGVGDIVKYSIERQVLVSLGNTDEVIIAGDSALSGSQYFSYSRYEDLATSFAGDPRVDGILPELRQSAAVVDQRTSRTKPRMHVSGIDVTRLQGFGVMRDVGGNEVAATLLGGSTVAINAYAAHELGARAGDRITIYGQSGPTEFEVGQILQSGGLAGSDPRVIMTIEQAWQTFGHEGEITRVNVSNSGGERTGANLSGVVTADLRERLADAGIASQLVTLVSLPENQAALRDHVAAEPDGRIRDGLRALATGGVAGPDSERLSALADPDVDAAVALALEQADRRADALSFSALAAALSDLVVAEFKADGLDQARRISDGVTSLFLIFGSFSIVVGMLLIFLIFVLLATARRTEMGITRAVGARRRQLVLTFLFEGVLYAFGAAVVGTAAGALASMLLVNFIPQSDQIGFTVVRHIELRSVIVAFSLGLVLTIATVIGSAYRVSRLNVVSAIRGLDEPAVGKQAGGVRERVTGMVVQGWPLLVVGGPLLAAGVSSHQALWVRAGVTGMLAGLGLMVRSGLKAAHLPPRARDRIAVSLAAALLIGFWGLPYGVLFRLFGDLEGGTAAFVFAGISMVAAAVAAVIFNAPALVWLTGLTFGRLGRATPVLRTAIAYPMAARFRTGLTLAMFSLVIFTLIVIAILTNTDQLALDHIDNVTGGYEITGSVPFDRAGEDVRGAIEAMQAAGDAPIEVIAATLTVGIQARQAGSSEQAWRPIALRMADDEFLRTNLLQMSHYDPDYGTSARATWDALRNDPDLAVLNLAALPARFQRGLEVSRSQFSASGLVQEGPAEMTAFRVELADPSGTRPPVTRTVIGVTDQLADLGGDFATLTTGAGVLASLTDRPIPYATFHLRLAPGADAAAVADRLEAGLLGFGFDATVNELEVHELLSINDALNGLFQAFMGLGLFVGVAALGVISFRAVVERRQAIGMLKAIGYRPRMIWFGFLLESSFVSVLGILLGIGLGSLISWNIVNELKGQVTGLRFSLPWPNVLLVVSITWGFSLLATLWPARQASRIYAAEALRYE